MSLNDQTHAWAAIREDFSSKKWFHLSFIEALEDHAQNLVGLEHRATLFSRSTCLSLVYALRNI